MQVKEMTRRMDPEDIVRSIEDFKKEHHMSGSLAVSAGGTLVYGKGFGISD
jgi:hypothetical protein